MPSVFTLFGELKADTKSFENSLRAAERDLKRVEREIDSTEKRARDLGQTSAVTARSFEKLRENVGRSRAQLTQAAAAFQKGDLSAARMATSLNKAGNATYTLSGRLKDTSARLTDLSNKTAESAGAFSRLAIAASAAAAAGLAVLGRFVVQSTMDLDALRIRLTAVTGSAEAGRQKFNELAAMSRKLTGVTTSAAAELYSLFRVMELGDPTINKLIGAMGKLKQLSPDIDFQTFGNNLRQLFEQGFELTDVKEFVGKSGIGARIMKEAFNLSSTDFKTIASEMKKKIADGMSKEDFFATFADAVNRDKTLNALGDSLSTKIAKLTDRMAIAFEPAGRKMLDAATPALESLASSVERIFSLGSPSSMIQQFFIEAAGAIISGGLMVAEAAANVAAAILDAMPFGSDAATAMRQQSLENINRAFNEIRQGYEQKAADAADNMREADLRYLRKVLDDPTASATLKQSAMKRYIALTEGITEGIKRTTQGISQGGTEIQQSLDNLKNNTNLSPQIADNIKKGLQTIPLAVNQATPNIQSAATNAGNVFGMSLENGLKQFQLPVETTAKNVANFAPLQATAAVHGSGVGNSFGTGLLNSLSSFIAPIAQMAYRIVRGAVDAAYEAADSNSPSMEMIKLGHYMGDGLIIGMKDRIKPIKLTAKEIAKAVLEEFKELGKSIKDAMLEKAVIFKDFAKYFQLRQQAYDAKQFNDELQNAIQKALELGIALKSIADVEAFQKVLRLLDGLDKLRGKAPALPDFTTTAKPTGAQIGAVDMSGLTIAEIGDAGESAATAWDTFFTMFSTRLNEIKSSLPSFKESLTVNLLESAGRIGDIFANAVEQWDGTMQGFFRSIASGFAQLAKQIISELIRIAVMQAVLKLVGLFAGAAFGGGASAGPASGAAGSAGGAGHGLFSGLTQTLSAAGKGLASGLSGLAGGGLTPSFAGASSIMNDNRTNNNFTFNVSGGGQGIDARTRQQMISEFTSIIRQHEMRKK